MSSQFDWIFEHETLPADDSPLLDPPAPERGPRLRRLLPAAGLILVGLGAVFYLWSLGGNADPLPGPDPTMARLEAAVQVEINALWNGDEEMFRQVQDSSSRRSNYQPPPEAWFTDGPPPGAIELIDLQLIDQDSARAEVRLTWTGSLYDLTWFYRQDDGHWLHTDWRPLDQGEPQQLASPNVQITYYAAYEHEAAVMLGQVEGFVTRFCELLPCSSQEPVSVTLEIDRFADYAVSEIAPFHYRIPSPLQIRWPAGGNPEPLVLASLGRQLAYDLWVRPRTGELGGENLAALTLATSWMAHRLLGADPLPATIWLEEAAVRDGTSAAITLISALSDGLDLHSALELAFRPDTVAAVAASPDYFAWLLLAMAPSEILQPPYSSNARSLASRPRLIMERLNLDADPWAVDGRYYGRALPEISEVRYQAGWAIAMVRADSGWRRAYFFRPDDELVWVPANLDGALAGEQRTARRGSFTVTYHEWDEPYVGEILREMIGVYETVNFNFDLHVTTTYSVSINIPQSPAMRADFNISSPAERALMGGSASPDEALTHEAEAAWGVAVQLLSDGLVVQDLAPEKGFMLYGMLNWQMDQLGHGSVMPLTDLGVDAWQPPAGASAGGWKPLADLWVISDEETEAEWLFYPPLITEYLVEEYGVQVVPEMVDALVAAGSMDEWVTAVTGRPLDEFEVAWREWVINRPRGD